MTRSQDHHTKEKEPGNFKIPQNLCTNVHQTKRALFRATQIFPREVLLIYSEIIQTLNLLSIKKALRVI